LIRPAVADDCRNLAALSIEVWLHTYALNGVRDDAARYVLDTFTADYFAQRIASPRYRLYVHAVDGYLQGYVCLDLETRCPVAGQAGVEVEKLYVQAHFKGQGIGSALLRAAMQDVGSKLWLSTWVHNAPAIGYYLAFGFNDIGQTWFELDGQQHENRVLAYAGS